MDLTVKVLKILYQARLFQNWITINKIILVTDFNSVLFTLKRIVVTLGLMELTGYCNCHDIINIYLLYQIEIFYFFATNKIDDLTCVIIHDNLMCRLS